MTKNKIISEYERRVWYRVVKSLYIFVFSFVFVVANYVNLFDGKFELSTFVIANIAIILFFRTVEGLFWYIITGKWGYPKDTEINSEMN